MKCIIPYIYIYICFFAFEWNERQLWRSLEYHLCELWFLIVGGRWWASLTTTAFQLLSSQTPFGSFITPLSSGHFTQFNYATHGENVYQWRRSFKKYNGVCCLRCLFYSGVTCLWPFTAGSYVINSAFKPTPPYTLNLLVGPILNGCTWRPKAVCQLISYLKHNEDK